MLVNSNKILKNYQKEKKAIIHFNINNLEWVKYILEEANNLNHPITLGVSEGAIKYMGGYKTVSNIVSGLIKDLNINIPVILHLDHGSSFESCKKAIDNDFTSVMIDGSSLNIEENINIVSKVVKYARKRNVSVEAEIGIIGGNEEKGEKKILYANVEDCIKLGKTKINSLAPAIGNVHGLYKEEPNLQFKLIEEIKTKTNLPLVLHGGTGVSDEDLKLAIKEGITKININTELQIAWSNAVREYLENNKEIYDPRKIIGAGEKAIKQVVNEKIKLGANLI